MARVNIHIVGWNHKRFLTRLFESLRAQTFKDTQILYIDNASGDGSLDLVRERFPEVVCLKNTNNLGMTGAHNQGFQLALSKWAVSDLQDRYVLVLNPEMVATPTLVEELVKAAERHAEAGSYGGKILKMFATEGLDRDLEQVDLSNIIDSTGLVRHVNGDILDRGMHEEDKGQYEAGEVWGISGAAVLYRASALEAVREGDAVFDTDYFSYQEDVDLAWRLQRAGFAAMYIPSAVTYRYCGAFGKKNGPSSSLVEFYSYRNHLLVLTKNLGVWEFFKTSYRLVPHEIFNFVYLLVFNPRALWKACWSYFRLWPKALRKRGLIRVR